MLVNFPAKDKTYCKLCTLFGTTTENSSKVDNLVKSALTFWTTACEKLKEHGLKPVYIKTATLKSENFYEIQKQSNLDRCAA